MLNSIVTTLLKREGKVSLTSIGIIVRADFEGDTTYLFTPTAAKLDNSLVAAIEAEMSVTQTEAVNILYSYIDFVKSVISKNGKYHLKEVGDIMQNNANIYYFTPLNTIEKELLNTELEEIKEDIVENKVILEEVKENIPELIIEEPFIEVTFTEEFVTETPDVIENITTEEATRLNERNQTRRLGEIIDGGANKRFYDKVHSQVVTSSNSTILTNEETVTQRRKGLYDIYDKGVVKKEVKIESSEIETPIVPTVENTPPSSPLTFIKQGQEKPKKKTDFVLIISIAIIILGLAFIGYFYYIQQSIEL